MANRKSKVRKRRVLQWNTRLHAYVVKYQLLALSIVFFILKSPVVQILQCINDFIGVRKVLRAGVGVLEGDTFHTGAFGRLHPVPGVFQDQAVGGFDVKEFRGAEEDLRIRLAPGEFPAADNRLEIPANLQFLQDHLNKLPG